MSSALRMSRVVSSRAPAVAIWTAPRIAAAPAAFINTAAAVKKSAPRVSSSTLATRAMSTKVDRPISPHVTIYAFPLPALSSIANRGTGVGLSVGIMAMSFTALGGACDIPSYLETVKTSVPLLMPLLKTVVAFPFVYHTAAGLRHIYWDKTAKGLDLQSVENSSKALIAGSVVLSLGLGLYSLPALK